MNSYVQYVIDFKTGIDFLRFALTKANAANLYYGHGTDNVFDDLVALIFGSLSLPLDSPLILLQANLTLAERDFLTTQIGRRILERVPMPYLIKEAYFCELAFYVDERVLIPRSPIAELINKQFLPWQIVNVREILDFCTGSGCIAIACAYAFPDAYITAVDISKDALDVASINREKHDLQERMCLIESDSLNKLPKKKYDLIVSNPPYVSKKEMQTLPPEYLHEPKLALEAGKEGIAIIAQIIQQAKEYLTENGLLVVEVGNSQQLVIDAFPTLPFTWLEFTNGGFGVFLLTKEQLR